MSDFLTEDTDLLTEGAEFFCPGGSMRFSCSEKANSKVVFGEMSKKLLTKDAKLSCTSTAPCALLTARNNQTPTPCQCKFTDWIDVDHSTLINGKPVLTKKSIKRCLNVPTCKIIVTFSGVRDHKIQSSKSASQPDTTSTGDVFETSDTATKQVDNSDGHKISKAPLQTALPPDAALQGQAATAIAQTEHAQTVSQQEKGRTNKESGKNADAKSEKIVVKWRCPNCHEQNCPERRKDSRIEKIIPLEVNNDPGKLNKKYEKYLAQTEDSKKTTADKAYDDARNKAEELKQVNDGKKPWTYQAHHIIPGNQVLNDKEFSDIVRMVHICEYDINGAENCIMLISKQDGHGKMPDNVKSISAYDAMSTAKIQWHLGQHQYRFDPEEQAQVKKRIAFYTKQPGEIKIYMDIVKSDLRKIKHTLNSKSICPDAFIQRMNKITTKIRDKLAAFQEKYHDSYPYYVSKEAYLFTFGIPQTNKIAVVRRVQNIVHIEKFRMSRKQNGENTIKPIQDDKTQTTPTLHLPCKTREEKKECIIFCSNIEHFVLIGNVQIDILPFDVQFTHTMNDTEMNTQQYLYEHASELFIWLRDSIADYTYTSPLEKIRERMKDAEDAGLV